MKNEYYPYSDTVCYHFYNNKGCTFCGYFALKRSVSSRKISDEEAIGHFDAFAAGAEEEILKRGKLIIAPNGSWFTEVPKRLRERIYDFVEERGVQLKYEARATLFIKERAKIDFHNYILKKGLQAEEENVLADLGSALEEIKPGHIVSFGLEVANDVDLGILNKGCRLEDYVAASKFVNDRGAEVGANILLLPPRIDSPIEKAFITAKFAYEQMGARDFLVMPCSPMIGTESYRLWKEGEWNPISATAASEIFRTMRKNFPDVNVRYLDLRVYTKHGRHGKFKRAPGKWSEAEKEAAREEVRCVAEKFFR